MVFPPPATIIESEKSPLRLAVLIDADNAQATTIESVLAAIARFGEVTIKRIYGDFTNPNSATWKKVLQQHLIKPIQQFAYTTGKNATDSTLIIDAMDLLYTRRFDGFCLITSDSDFTSLAIRLREEGLYVFGFGEQKTPEAFRNACHQFIFIETLRPNTTTPSNQPSQKVSTETKVAENQPAEPAKPKLPFPKQAILNALKNSIDKDGWVELPVFGSHLAKLHPGFNSKHYGYKKLSDLVKAKPELIVTEERKTAGTTQKTLYLRAR